MDQVPLPLRTTYGESPIIIIVIVHDVINGCSTIGCTPCVCNPYICVIYRPYTYTHDTLQYAMNYSSKLLLSLGTKKEGIMLEQQNKCERKEMEMREGGDEVKQKQSSSRFRRVCVFCGSSPGNKSSYKEAAIELGKELVKMQSI